MGRRDQCRFGGGLAESCIKRNGTDELLVESEVKWVPALHRFWSTGEGRQHW